MLGPHHIDGTTKTFFHGKLWAVANHGFSGGGIVAHMAGLASRVDADVSLWEQLAHIRYRLLHRTRITTNRQPRFRAGRCLRRQADSARHVFGVQPVRDVITIIDDSRHTSGRFLDELCDEIHPVPRGMVSALP